MDIQKELDDLANKEQNLRNKFGRRFTSFYNGVISSMANNRRIIDHAETANQALDVDLKEVINALETIDYKEGV